jgi:hypothetical protein
MPACINRDDPQIIYAATRKGLTMLFENPSLDAETRAQSRYQLVVRDAVQTPQGLEVTASIASLQSTGTAVYLCLKDGGIYMYAADRERATVMLPPGFPFETKAWQTAGVNYRVMGRANADIPSVKLPNPIGIWVESVPAQSHPQAQGDGIKRVLMLPGIGEAETRVFRNGSWVAINRLVGLGYAEGP